MKINCWDDMINGDKDAFLAIYHEHYRALFSMDLV